MGQRTSGFGGTDSSGVRWEELLRRLFKRPKTDESLHERKGLCRACELRERWWKTPMTSGMDRTLRVLEQCTLQQQKRKREWIKISSKGTEKGRTCGSCNTSRSRGPGRQGAATVGNNLRSFGDFGWPGFRVFVFVRGKLLMSFPPNG